MKKVLPLFFLLVGFTLFGQQNVRLQIEHQLNGNPFTTSYVAQNDLGDDFKTTRLQYYIAEIVLVHDGGQFTPVTNTWFLVDATQAFDESLGSFPISNLEAIRFAIGVEQPTNNQDPASYPSAHPLAPKNPSMHWGWQAGYRFVCMEGTSGTGTSQVYEIHALGNNNYITQQINTVGMMQTNDLIVSLSADYAKAVEGIDLSNGLIRHGTSLESADLLDNFSLHVFTSHDGNGSNLSQEEIELFAQPTVYPNPSLGEFNISLYGEWNYQLIDLMGREILSGNHLGQNGVLTINVNEAGVYLLRLTNSAGKSLTQKLIRK